MGKKKPRYCTKLKQNSPNSSRRHWKDASLPPLRPREPAPVAAWSGTNAIPPMTTSWPPPKPGESAPVVASEAYYLCCIKPPCYRRRKKPHATAKNPLPPNEKKTKNPHPKPLPKIPKTKNPHLKPLPCRTSRCNHPLAGEMATL